MEGALQSFNPPPEEGSAPVEGGASTSYVGGRSICARTIRVPIVGKGGVAVRVFQCRRIVVPLYKRAALGAEAGLLAGTGVALLFLIQDSVTLAPLSTPEALASTLFGPVGYSMDDGLVAQAVGMAVYGFRLLSYTLLHFLAFALLGVGAAFALRGVSWLASLGGGALYGLTACSAVFYGTRLVLESPVMLEQLGVPSVLIANVVAGTIMGGGLHLVSNPDGTASQDAVVP